MWGWNFKGVVLSIKFDFLGEALFFAVPSVGYFLYLLREGLKGQGKNPPKALNVAINVLYVLAVLEGAFVLFVTFRK